MINPNIDFNQLYHLMNHQQAANRTKIKDKFPLDREKDIENSVSHPGSREALAYIKTNPQKSELNKLMPRYFSDLLDLCACQEEKSVCAKIVKGGETIVQCFDCRADASCIICMDCFKNGNHKGHRVIFKKAGGGCCDCGDIEAWKEEGFCSRHSGKIKQIQITMPERITSNQILSELYFILCWLKLSDDKFFVSFLADYIRFLEEMVRISIKGIKLISIFLDQQIPANLVLSSKLAATPLQQIFNADFLSERQFNLWEKLFIEMFPYYPFKQQLITNYFKCFSSLYGSEHRKGESIACQIVTSYKLVEDYSDSKDAIPIIIPESDKISDVSHKTKMMTYDLHRINTLQGEAPLKYWSLVIRHGIRSMFGYYQTLKNFARKQKRAALKAEGKKQRKKKDKKNKLFNLEEQMLDENQDDVSFNTVEFVQRHHQIIEVEYTILEEFIEIMPIISQHQALMLELIRSIFTILIDEIKNDDDLLIFRPYERLLGVALFFYARQTPFVLSNPKLRQGIRQKINISQSEWENYLTLIQKRMMQTFGFFSHMQSCQSQGYHTSFYTYLMLYASKYCLLGHADVLVLRELIFLGAPELKIDFASIAKLDRLEPPNKWNLRSLSALVTELGLLYLGSFTQIYISFYSEKSNAPEWLVEQARRALRKFITAEGGSVSLQRAQQFSNNFLFKDQDDLKAFLKQLCQFNKQKKMFELLPANIDKQALNFRDFKFRTNIQNQAKGILDPRFTLQFIDKANKLLFTNVWNQKNIESLCQILLEINQDVQKSKDKDELIEYYSIPCRLLYFLRQNQVLTNFYASLSELLQTFQVSNEIRKALGVLANFFSAPIEEICAENEDVNQQKELLRLKKLKKLEELKKKNIQNVEKAKAKHAIEVEEEQVNRQDECVICRKTGGNLVWVAKMSIRNLEKILQLGEGALTLSFMSCYHAFDFECIEKNAIKRSTHEYLFRCPVCRSLGNVFLSIAGKQNVHENMAVQASLDRIMHVAMTMRQYTQFNIYEQIFKSFYHLILLGFLQPQYVLQKRMRLYKQIISILCNKKLKDHVKEIQRKLQNNEIALEPKSTSKKVQAVNLHHEIAIAQEDILDDDSDYDSDEEQPWEQLLGQILLPNPQAETQQYKELRSKKKKKIEKKQKDSKKQPTPLFCYVLRRILAHILKAIDIEDQMISEQPQKQEIKKEEGEMVEIQLALPLQTEMKEEDENKIEPFNPEPWAVRLVDELLDEKTCQSTVQLVPHTLLKIIPLPERFYWDLTDSSCNQCGNVCSDLFLCLLCNWRGCLNNCQHGGLKAHNKKHHGQSGAFLRLKDANAYLISPGELNKIGCLYLNEWGEEFDQSADWNKYTLQASVAKKVVEMLIKNE